MEPLPAWYLRRRAHYLPGNEVRLLKGGDELFPALVAAVNQARYEVWLTTYIFHDDASARALAQALTAAAQRGVRVRV
ncbi:MAG: phospholipase D-like domain-containing protein, partial [Betaproteobacteria bacterium]